MLPLPPSTERIWRDGRNICRAYPCRRWFRDWCGDWDGVAEDEGTAEAMVGARVYHVPQPAPAAKPAPLDQLAAEAQAEGEYGVKCPKCGGPAKASRTKGWYGCPDPQCRQMSFEVVPAPTPTPRRTAREVAEEIAKRYSPDDGDRTRMSREIAAAIERDREGR